MAVDKWKLEYWLKGKLQETHHKEGVIYPVCMKTMKTLATSTHRSGTFKIVPHSFK